MAREAPASSAAARASRRISTICGASAASLSAHLRTLRLQPACDVVFHALNSYFIIFFILAIDI